MQAQVARGEHQGFDAAEVTKRHEGGAIDGKVIFICPTAERLLIQLVRAKKLVIDNQVVDQEQQVVQFQEYTYISSDPDEIAKIRKHKAYTQGTIKELAQVANQAREKRVSDVLAQLEDPAIKAAVSERLGLGKSNVPTVKDTSSKK